MRDWDKQATNSNTINKYFNYFYMQLVTSTTNSIKTKNNKKQRDKT